MIFTHRLPWRLCEARFANLVLLDGDGFRRAAMHNAPAVAPELRKIKIQLALQETFGRNNKS
jgi:hypothetical protein